MREIEDKASGRHPGKSLFRHGGTPLGSGLHIDLGEADTRREAAPDLGAARHRPAADPRPVEKAAAPPAGNAETTVLAKATAGSAVRQHRESGHTEAVEYENGFLWARTTDPEYARYVGDGIAVLAGMRP